MKTLFAALLLCHAMPAPAQESLEPVSVPEETIQKLRIHTVRPVLPPETQAFIPGTVALQAVINKTGTVESVEMISGHPMLVPAALEAVRQWKYRGYEVNGIPRAVETTIHVEFSNESAAASETSVRGVESPIFVTADDVPVQSVYRVAPIYPPLARQARIQGIVILRIAIDQAGEVRNVRLVSGHPMLAPAAIETFKKWRYMPYEVDGRTVAVETDVQVVFRIAGG